MTKRIFHSIFLASLAVLTICSVLIFGALYQHFSQVQVSQLRTETTLAAQGISRSGSGFLQQLELQQCRITWIDPSGNVLYDSHSESTGMTNHLQREEIREALETGYGESVRYSDTLMERTIYAAQRLPDGTVVRLSVAHSSVLDLFLEMIGPLLAVFAASLILSLLLAFRLSKMIVAPLNRLDLEKPMVNREYEELIPLLSRLNSQQRQLQLQKTELARRQEEFNTVINGMGEGLVLLNNKGHILSINQSASLLLGIGKTSGTDILLWDKGLELQPLLLEALTGNRSEKNISLSGGEYQIAANPVFSDGILSGVVILIFDITKKHQAEQLRREFTANVSHELKTPLQSISGYAELLSGGLAQGADVIRFSEKIHTEAQRMIRLVSDIIRLSRLDEGAEGLQREKVALHSLAAQILASLEDSAQAADITLSLQAQPTELTGVKQLLSGILFNLCDNAIKYNRPGGEVTVWITHGDDRVRIRVQDTGIGIPREDQERIFERFYRVDKSRSKEVGGTGLGLSIVKHSVLIHNGTIHLESVPGTGTTVTVELPQ